MIDWSWYLMALSMGDPMFDADLNPVFADDGSKAREAMNLLLSYFSDELISPEILAGSIAAQPVLERRRHVPSGLAGVDRGWQACRTSQQAIWPACHSRSRRCAGACRGHRHQRQFAQCGSRWQFIQWYVAPERQAAIYNAFGLYPSRTWLPPN